VWLVAGEPVCDEGSEVGGLGEAVAVVADGVVDVRGRLTGDR
jgi:hypothetical protein